jgi:hypothetical protein
MMFDRPGHLVNNQLVDKYLFTFGACWPNVCRPNGFRPKDTEPCIIGEQSSFFQKMTRAYYYSKAMAKSGRFCVKGISLVILPSFQQLLTQCFCSLVVVQSRLGFEVGSFGNK